MRKLSTGGGSASNDSISLWHDGTQIYGAALWKDSDPAGTTNTQVFDIGALPAAVHSGKPVTLNAGQNKLTPLVNNVKNQFSFMLQDDTAVLSAQLEYICGGRVVVPGGLLTPIGTPTGLDGDLPPKDVAYGFTPAVTANTACGPWQVCFDVNVPNFKGQGARGTAKIGLLLMQNGKPVKTLVSPVLNADGKYCFTVNPSDITAGLGGFDYVATTEFSVPGAAGMTKDTKSIGSQPEGIVRGQNNDVIADCNVVGGATASTCCPPLTGAANMYNMFTQTAHPAGQGYTMVANGGPQYTNLANGYNAYLALLKFMCPNVVALKVTWSLHNSTAVGAAGVLSPAFPGGLGFATSTFTGSGVPGVVQGSPALSSFIAQPGAAYGIAAHTVGVDAAGNPVKCGFDAQNCDQGDRFTFQWSIGGRQVGGAGAAPLNFGN